MILTIAIFTAVAGLVIYNIRNIYYPTKKQERQITMARYKKLQDLSLQLQSGLSEYVSSINATEEVTCIYNKLVKSHDKYLSDYSYEKLKHTRSHSYIKKVRNNLKLQHKELKTAKKHIVQLQKHKSLAY